MLDTIRQVLGILIICALAIAAIALLVFTTSRLKWMVVGFLWSAALTNFGHREWTSTLAGLTVVALLFWDEHLRTKKVDAIIEDKLATSRLMPGSSGTNREELERFAGELRQAFPRCLSLL